MKHAANPISGKAGRAAGADAGALEFFELRLARPAAPVHTSPCLDAARLRWRNGVVVRATNWLGDTLMSLPAVYKLRAFLPEHCGLFVVCPAALAPVWQAASWVDRVIPLTGRRVDGDAAREVRRLLAGVGVVLPNSFGSALDLFRKGIPVRVGRAGRLRTPLLSHTLPPKRHTMHVGAYHQLTELLELVSVFGEVPWDALYPALRCADSATVLKKLGVESPGRGPFLALAPGAAYGPAKQWSEIGFRTVSEWWTARGGRVLAVGSRGEAASAAKVTAGLPGTANLAGKTALAELMSVLRACVCVVANDSGVMHLAAGLGVPGVALFGSTDPVATGPLGAPWVTVTGTGNHDCAPCFERRCRFTGADCLGLRSIPAARVCAAIEFVLAAAAPRR